jgi:hypothetical protein
MYTHKPAIIRTQNVEVILGASLMAAVWGIVLKQTQWSTGFETSMRVTATVPGPLIVRSPLGG